MQIENDGPDRPVEVTDEALRLIHTWVELASKSEPEIVKHEADVACVLICAAARTRPGVTIGAPEIYEGWSRQIGEKVVPTIGLCPPHECLFRSIVEDREDLVRGLLDDSVSQWVQRHWDTDMTRIIGK